MFWEPSAVRPSNNISIVTRLICWAAVVLNERSTPFYNVLSKKDSATSNSGENVLVFYSICFVFSVSSIIKEKRRSCCSRSPWSFALYPLSFSFQLSLCWKKIGETAKGGRSWRSVAKAASLFSNYGWYRESQCKYYKTPVNSLWNTL